MITCRPDISYPPIKLSQYSNNPAEEYYNAAKQIFKYIKATRTEGMYFWRKDPCNDLADLPLPKATKQTHQVDPSTYCDEPTLIHGAVDSDWAGDKTTANLLQALSSNILAAPFISKQNFKIPLP